MQSDRTSTEILRGEGTKEEGDVAISFTKEDSDIKGIRARTIEPDGRIVNFDGKVFEKTIARNGGNSFLAKVFSLPEVQPGCIVEYRYRKQYAKVALVHTLHSEHWILSGQIGRA